MKNKKVRKLLNEKQNRKSAKISSNVSKVLKGAAAAGLAIGGVAVMSEETNMDVYAADGDGEGEVHIDNHEESNEEHHDEPKVEESHEEHHEEPKVEESHEEHHEEPKVEESHEEHDEGDSHVSTDTKATETEHHDEGSVETKTETTVTEESRNEDEQYPESFGEKDEEKSSTEEPVTNEDGSTTTTEHNVYTQTGENGSTSVTEETIKTTVTPGGNTETKELENDGTEHTAVKVDENGNPVLDENGNPVTEVVKDWKGTETTTTGETTTKEYTAKTTTTEKAASENEANVDKKLTEWQLTDANGEVVKDAEGNPIVISKGETAPTEDELTAVPATDENGQAVTDEAGNPKYTITVGGKTFTLTADEVKDSTTAFHVKGTEVSVDSSLIKESTETNADGSTTTHKEVEVVRNADGTYSFKDAEGNVAVDENGEAVKENFADGVVKSREVETGKTVYYIDNGTDNGVVLENGAADITSVVKNTAEDQPVTYTITLKNGSSVTVTAEQAKGHVTEQTNPEGTYQYKDSKGATQTAANKEAKLAVTQTTDEKGNAVYTATKADGTVLTFDKAEKNADAGKDAYYFKYKAADGEEVKVEISKDQLTKAELQKEGEHQGQYKVSVDGKDYYVDKAETEDKLTVQDAEGEDKVVADADLTKDGKVVVEKQADGTYTKELADGTTLTVSAADSRNYVYVVNETTGEDEKVYLEDDEQPEQDKDGNWTISGRKISTTSLHTEKGESTAETFEIEVNDGEGTKKISVSSGKDQEVFKNKDGKYVIRDGEKEYVITNQSAVRTILATADPIYQGDSDLEKISKILGDVGVTANKREGAGHMDSNYRYGESKADIVASSNSTYVKEAANKGGDAYIGYVTQNIDNAAKTEDASSTKTLHINLKKDADGKTTQDLVKEDSIYYVRELTKNEETGEYEYKNGAQHRLQNFESVVVEENDIATQIKSDIEEISKAAVSLHGKTASEGITVEQQQTGAQKNVIDVTGASGSIVYVNLDVTSRDGKNAVLSLFDQAEKAQIKFNSNQTIVFNVNTGSLGADSVINLYKYRGFVTENGKEQDFIAENEEKTTDNSSNEAEAAAGTAARTYMSHLVFNFGNYKGTVNTSDHFGGFLILPDATLQIGTTSSGRVVANTYKTGGSEWHYYGSNDSGEKYVIKPVTVPGTPGKETTTVVSGTEYYVAPETTAFLKGTEGKLDTYYVLPEAAPTTTISYTPFEKAETTTVLYVEPEANKVAEVAPQYYKVTVTEYTKSETSTSQTVVRQYTYTVKAPENPGTPETPGDTPDNPGTPETPEDHPDNPGTPETPHDNPDTPGTPETPEEGGKVLGAHRDRNVPEQGGAVLGVSRSKGGSTGGGSTGTGTSGSRNARTGDDSQMNLYGAGMAAGAAALAAWGVAKKKEKKDAKESQ